MKALLDSHAMFHNKMCYHDDDCSIKDTLNKLSTSMIKVALSLDNGKDQLKK